MTSHPPSHAKRETHYHGLRGLACLLVLCSHFRYQNFYIHELVAFGRFAQFGLFIFFFLSAFLITKSVLFGVGPFHVRGWISYFVRRFFRIWPLFAVTIGLDLMFFHHYFGTAGPVSTQAVIDHLLFRYGYGPLWTMPVEVRFYVLLVPLMFALALSMRSRSRLSAAWVLLLFCLSLAWLVWIAVTGDKGTLATWGVHSYAPYFVVGCTTAGVAIRFRGWLARIPPWIPDAIGLSALAVTLLQNPYWWQAISPWQEWVYDPANIDGLSFEDYLRWRMFGFVPVFALLFLCLESEAHRLRAIFSVAPLAALGRISFGVYLLHEPMLRVVQAHVTTARISGFASALFLTCTIAAVLHRLVEMPGIRLGDRFLSLALWGVWREGPEPGPKSSVGAK